MASHDFVLIHIAIERPKRDTLHVITRRRAVAVKGRGNQLARAVARYSRLWPDAHTVEASYE